MATTTISTPTHHAAADRSRDAQPLLAATGMSKRFGSVEALADVDFAVCAGEVVVAGW